ncbi:MAG: hypothetical protein Q7J06_01030, partial [Bacteroidales bacterium]|nr:hypothetical protein [Bacteroidales bacterium]
MLHNIYPSNQLRSLFRSKYTEYEAKSVHPKLVEEFISEGWVIEKRNKNSVRIRRPKSHGTLLEDKVWLLFYRMGFSYLSAAGGAKLSLSAKEPKGPQSQIDVVAIDDEVAIAIECKSSEKHAKRPQFQEELGKLSLIREKFSHSVNNQYSSKAKQQIVLAMFITNIGLSDHDKERAKQANVQIFEEKDIEYYQQLVNHIGPA